ncbi:MAG: endopeptidase La [Thermodesulfovibrionia bacterium]|nr:endopeptidase La [Thermodesulfovibrionia bacterium]
MGFFKKSEENDQAETVAALRQLIVSAGLPLYVQKIINKEMEMLSKISPATAEYTIGLTYINYLLDLPWGKKTEDNLDLERAARILEERHYGLDEIKQRILEHLSVRILVKNRKSRILVVDDEKIVVRNLDRFLKKEGYSVVTATSGAEAFERLDESDFDLVMTDLKMKDIDGISVIQKAKDINVDIQAIMITGYASVDTAIEAIKKGAFHYLKKPFKLEEVSATVQKALEKKQSSITTINSVLCFAGPPGTGKTSLGRAVADALGRKFARISVGGMKDEAEIMGHRRTYAGAMPGRIIDEIQRTGVSNPLLMLDEMDKIGHDFKGDPSSALLEVLDPEQNASFIDHYLDVPFDLSGVMFIVTANIADNMQNALRDRMEIIEFSGYTEDEKREIALRYLVSKQTKMKGLSDNPPKFSVEAVEKIIHEHTHEAGIRSLERQIATICRKIATGFVNKKSTLENVTVTPETVEKYLGPRKYYFEVTNERNRVGVTTGLVWTEVGGAIIFIEAAKMKGNRELILTGSLGDVMRESAQAALSYIRSNAALFNIDENFFEGQDIHVHVPQGSIPKDGPSAGSTIAVALISLLTARPARRDVAVSGEMTLTGRILPVGGIKEKMIAARQAGVKIIVLPLKNRVDVETLSDNVKRDLEIIHADNIEDVVDLVLVKE